MKLIIKKLSIKNFFSVGNVPFEYNFTEGFHLVKGRIVNSDVKNGVGKSQAFIDSLIFAFYGVSIRNLNADDMVNDINDAECECTLWFTLDGINYRIERGLKPKYLRFINEDSTEDQETKGKRQVQDDINEKLGISYTTFVNKITLNINYSKPFFKLDAKERRQIFEDIMNISIYGKILTNVRKEYNDNKNILKVSSSELIGIENVYKEKIKSKAVYDSLVKNFDDQKSKDVTILQEKIDKLITEKESIILSDKDLNKLQSDINTKIYEFNKKISELTSINNKNEGTIHSIEKNLGLLSSGSFCPVCNSQTDSEDIYKHKKSLYESIDTLTLENKTNEERITKIEGFIEQLNIKLQNIEKLIKMEEKKIQKIDSLTLTIDDLNEQLNVVKTKTLDTRNFITDKEISECKLTVDAKKQEYENYAKDLKFSDTLREILGDNGIKPYIIKKIVPSLNKKINEYLTILKSDSKVVFDKELNETFRSQKREKKYNNFSAGEQKKIDLACMFALFDIAKAQNSLDCNILILDEICDSSICKEGTLNLINFLKTDFINLYPNMCVYVISHKSEMEESNFNSIIHLKKENGFTKLEKIEEVDQILQV